MAYSSRDTRNYETIYNSGGNVKSYIGDISIDEIDYDKPVSVGYGYSIRNVFNGLNKIIKAIINRFKIIQDDVMSVKPVTGEMEVTLSKSFLYVNENITQTWNIPAPSNKNRAILQMVFNDEGQFPFMWNEWYPGSVLCLYNGYLSYCSLPFSGVAVHRSYEARDPYRMSQGINFRIESIERSHYGISVKVNIVNVSDKQINLNGDEIRMKYYVN